MTVALMLGFSGTMEHPSDLDAATQALRRAVGARGKKWKRVAPLFSFVRAGNALAVGVVLRKAPQSFDAPSSGFQGGPVALTHRVVGTYLRSDSVDDHSEVIDGLLPALDAIESTLAPLGVHLEGRRPGQLVGGHCALLVSVDGSPGVLTHGGPSSLPAAAPLHAWTVESTRFVGHAIAAVDAEHRIVALPMSSPQEESVQYEARRRVLEAAGIEKAPLLLLALDDAPIALAATPERRAVPTSYVLRSFADLRASFVALKPSERARTQTLDGIEALSFDDLATWPDGAVNDAVARLAEPPTLEQRSDAAAFLRLFPLRGTLGTWNAAGEARIAHGESWAVLDLTLTREQEEDASVGASLALVRTTDGWVAISWSGSDVEGFRRVLGFDPFASSETKWTKARVVHGR